MAGRGTDIKLGEGVDELGGLYVLGTERHEARRIDRQLRGRCARQGDNGTSKFLVSLEDDLFRISGKVPFGKLLDRTFTEGQPIDHPLLNRSIQHAQKAAEGRNYSIRKRLLQYDDVLNKQREVIYGLRNEVLTSDQTRAMIFDFINDELDEKIAAPQQRDGFQPERGHRAQPAAKSRDEKQPRGNAERAARALRQPGEQPDQRARREIGDERRRRDPRLPEQGERSRADQPAADAAETGAEENEQSVAGEQHSCEGGGSAAAPAREFISKRFRKRSPRRIFPP